MVNFLKSKTMNFQSCKHFDLSCRLALLFPSHHHQILKMTSSQHMSPGETENVKEKSNVSRCHPINDCNGSNALPASSGWCHLWSPMLYLYTVSQKNIPDIFNCILKTNYQILIILAQIFLTQLAIKWPFSFSPHPMYASALPRESRSTEICIKINRKPEKHPQHYRSYLE